MNKRLNKKGQDLTIGTLILIALGVVVLVLLIVGFTRGWDFVFGKFELAPGQDLEAVAQACKFSKEAGLRIDYCDFKKIDYQGKTEYVNCADTRLASAIAEAQGDDIECDINAARDYCENTELKEDALVNGETCASYGAPSQIVGPPAN